MDSFFEDRWMAACHPAHHKERVKLLLHLKDRYSIRPAAETVTVVTDVSPHAGDWRMVKDLASEFQVGFSVEGQR
jgi:hypothetical protein